MQSALPTAHTVRDDSTFPVAQTKSLESFLDFSFSLPHNLIPKMSGNPVDSALSIYPESDRFSPSSLLPPWLAPSFTWTAEIALESFKI